MSRRTLQLSRLRQIGWDLWDPIGLRDLGEGWKTDAADEYDSYLLRAATMLTQGSNDEETTTYLTRIASDHMGLGSMPTHAEAAARTVQAIRAYLNEAS